MLHNDSNKHRILSLIPKVLLHIDVAPQNTKLFKKVIYHLVQSNSNQKDFFLELQ